MLRDWERRGLQQVTLREIASAVGEKVAHTAAAALVRKGVLDRIGRGVYLIHPFRAVGMPWTRSTLVLVALLLGEQNYYVGGPAAFTLHHLTQQFHGSVVDVYVLRYLAPRTLGSARVVFHRVRPETKLFLVGITTVTLEGTGVRVSDEQRAVLDALEYPNAVGGLAAGVRLAAQCIPRLDHSLLVDYAIAIARPSTRQRLGVLLERAGADREVLERLRAHVRATRNLPAMYPAQPRVGRVHPVWHVVENDLPANA